MSMSARAGSGRPFDAAMFRAAGDDAEQIHQLRHQTKNLLQAITLTLVDASLEMPSSAEDLVQDLVRRIQVTAAMADILFGATGPRTSFEATLKALCENVVRAFGPSGCRLTVDVRGRASCPQHLHRDLLRAAHEMVGNAVKHGQRGRGDRSAMSGKDTGIRVRLRRQSQGVSLTVQDQGPGFPPGVATRPGGGTRTLDHLARTMSGRLSRRNWRGAVIRLVVPLDRQTYPTMVSASPGPE